MVCYNHNAKKIIVEKVIKRMIFTCEKSLQLKASFPGSGLLRKIMVKPILTNKGFEYTFSFGNVFLITSF